MAKLTDKQIGVLRECGIRDDGWKPPMRGYTSEVVGLVRRGFMQEVGVSVMPPFKLYNLTDKGRALRASLVKT